MLSPLLFIGDAKRYHSLCIALTDLGIKAEQVNSNKALAAVTTKDYAAVILDWNPPSSSQLETFRQIRKRHPKLPVVTLRDGSEGKVSLMEPKEKLVQHLPVSGDEKEDLASLVESLKLILPELRAQVLAAGDLLWIETSNSKMAEVIALVDILKDEPSSVLIQGENGTGKEVIARLLHYTGRRYESPFVAINCAAIPETLLESELFGHEKGSFTGATERRIGKFELAHKGTAFLDEIGDMPLNTQVKILRALETGEIERVGGHEKIPVDLRIVASTNKNLLQEIDKGNFRQDLYFRINTFTLNLPPLRERKEDILLLAQHFLDLHITRRGTEKKRLSQVAEQLLLSHNWPGNVRELRNAMERAVVLAAGSVVESEVLPDEIRKKQGQPTASLDLPQNPPAGAEDLPPITPLRELERAAIIETLSQLGNNVTKTAKHLGISKATLFRKLKKYGFSRQIAIKS